MGKSNTDSLRRAQRQDPDSAYDLPRYGNERRLQAELKVKTRRADRQRDKHEARQAIQSRDF
jgi:hypothetical protein